MKKIMLLLTTVAMVTVFSCACSNESKNDAKNETTEKASTTDAPKTTEKSNSVLENTSSNAYVPDSEIKFVYTDTKKYTGMKIKLTGEVFNDPEYDSEGVYFQMYADPQNSDLNTVIGYKDKSLQLKNGDYVEIDGEVRGTASGTNAFGGKVESVTVVANSIKLLSYQDVFQKQQKKLL